MNREELKKCIGRTFEFVPCPRRDTSTGSWESDMNLWILLRETPDKKAFEFQNTVRDHHPFILDLHQIRNFDAPDKLILRGQVILKDDSINYEPFHPKPSSETRPTVLTMFLEDLEDEEIPLLLSIVPQSLKFCIRNTGHLTVRDFRTTLVIPSAFKISAPLSTKLSMKGEQTINETHYIIYDHFSESPIYKNEQIRIVELSLRAGPSDYIILWKIRCDDGTFPKDDEYGQIKVRFKALDELLDEAVQNVHRKR